MRSFGQWVRSAALAASFGVGGMVLAFADPTPHSTLQYQASWIGNTFGEPNKWVQKDALGLAVGSDGTCYVPGTWDEVHKGLGFYRDGQPVGQCENLSVGEGGVAVDDKYVYAMVPADEGSKSVTRLQRWTLDGKMAPPAAGFDTTTIDFGHWTAGVCAYRGEVFVQDAQNDEIRVYNRDSLVEKRSFACKQPYRLAVDGQGLLWVLTVDANVAQYTLDGHPTGKAIPRLDGATSIAFAPNGRLLVAGPNNQVLKYDVAGAQPALVGALGVKGGVYAGQSPGAMGQDRLFGLVGVGADSAGAIYTASRSYAMGGSFDLRKFAPGGKLVWELVNQGFTDCAGVDPGSDGADVYTRAEHFHLDLAKAAGNQSTWVGYTLNPANDDGRIDIGGFLWASPMVRRLHGHLYMYDHPGPYVGVFRKGPGDVFIPCCAFNLAPAWLIWSAPSNDHYHELDWPASQPAPRVRWAWRDLNGDGKVEPGELEAYPDKINEVEFITNSWVDGVGNIWVSGSSSAGRTLWKLPLDGFDNHDNPIYKFSSLTRVPLPPEFNEVWRIVYAGASDTMYLSGVTKDYPNGIGGSIGTELIRYDHWSTSDRSLRWRIRVPTGSANNETYFPCLAIAGDKVFLMQRFWSRIWTYDANTSAYVGMIKTTPETGTSGWCDMENGISAFQRKNGDYLIFAEDDYRPKIRMYIVPPQAWTPQPLPAVDAP